MEVPTYVVQYRRPNVMIWRDVSRVYSNKQAAEAKADQLYELGHTVRVVDVNNGQVLMDKEY